MLSLSGVRAGCRLQPAGRPGPRSMRSRCLRGIWRRARQTLRPPLAGFSPAPDRWAGRSPPPQAAPALPSPAVQKLVSAESGLLMTTDHETARPQFPPLSFLVFNLVSFCQCKGTWEAGLSVTQQQSLRSALPSAAPGPLGWPKVHLCRSFPRDKAA